jgi:hypothetical protein
MVRDQSLLSGFNNPLRSCRTGRPGRVTAVPADRFYFRTVSQKYLGASSAFPFTRNPMIRIAIQSP